MNHNDTVRLKLAWQAAYEQRTCPDLDILRAPQLDERLAAHLAVCQICRQKREMPPEEVDAWRDLIDAFRSISIQSGTETKKQAGQVWSLDPKLAGWDEENRYMKPPVVLLLDEVEGTSGWLVAQLYSDKMLMGNGDVELDDRFGFAEAWNCYTLHEKVFSGCLGAIPEADLIKVRNTSILSHESAKADSILSFFRQIEIQVGAHVAIPCAIELVDAHEKAIVEERELIHGLVAIISETKEFGLRIFGNSLEALHDAFSPQKSAFVTRGLQVRGEESRISGADLSQLPDDAIRLIKDNIPLVPVEAGFYIDGYRLYFQVIGDADVKLSIVSVKIDGVEVSGITMQDWHTTKPYILIENRVFRSIEIRFHGSTFYLEGMPDES